MNSEDKGVIRDALFFIIITLGLSWFVFWGPIAILGIPAISFVKDVRGPTWAILLFILGGFVPSLVGIALTGFLEGRDGLRTLFTSSVQFKLGFKWYFAILVVVLLGTMGQIGIQYVTGKNFDYSLFLSQLPSFLPLIIIGPISEEFGWREYLLKRLQKKWNALISSLIVGIVWSLWHLPLFFMVGTSQHELKFPFIGFLVGLTAISIIMTWLHNNTAGSVWTAILFHWLFTWAMQVVSTGVSRSVVYNWLEYSPYVLMALFILLVWKPKTLSKNHKGIK